LESIVGGEEAAKLQQAINEWRPQYEKAIECAAAEIYVALRKGRLTAKGKLLPDPDPAVALRILAKQKQSLAEIDDADIPKDFWSLRHIYWEPSAARNDHEHYCQIWCDTDQVMSLFPYDKLCTGEPVTLMRHGPVFVLGNATAEQPTRPRSTQRARGRPPGSQFQWGFFHCEMTQTIIDGKLPSKKEAAIDMVQGWFKQRGLKTPSRSIIQGELAPYYERTFRLPEK